MSNWKNVWLGDNELVLFFKNGTFHVIEKYEDYAEVFTGNYDQCIDYMNRRELDYLMSMYA